MARGPDGSGGGAGFSLSDQLFNADSLGALAAEYATLPGFDPDRFLTQAVAGLSGRGLLERLDWIADCIEAQLPRDFPAMAEALEAAMPPKLDPARNDGDFGRFIHAVPGILAVRHGLEDHRERALDLLHAATQRFSMEFYIRPFLNRWPDETLARLDDWVGDDNYHVRRLVSEGTRPRLPWACNITLAPEVPLRFLDALHADPTRYVTRSVANHMNDLSKQMPDRVVDHLARWREAGTQTDRELAWMTRHALRTAIKRGERVALDFLGYRAGGIEASVTLSDDAPRIGTALGISVTVRASDPLSEPVPVMIDYRIRFARPSGRGEKVFKLKAAHIPVEGVLSVTKAHRLKGDATTFKLHPGRHELIVQVNGQDMAQTTFDLRAAPS